MARRSFWKGDDALVAAPVESQEDALRAAFGDEGLRLLATRVPNLALRLVEQHGFRRADLAPVLSFTVVDGVLHQRGTVAALPGLIAQSITVAHDVEDRVRLACDFFGLRFLAGLQNLIPLLTRGVTSRDDENIRARFEPPHGEGNCFVCCVADDPDVVRPAGIFRCITNADTLTVELEHLGSMSQQIVRRGRAHVDEFGAAVVAPVAVAASSSSSPWIEQAQTEHASIAAFARLTLELMALGAPLDLVARVQTAALDEVRHTQQCLALAQRDGVVVDIGPLPALAPRSGTKAELAQRTHDEAVIPESAAIVQMRNQLADVDERTDGEAHAVLAQQIVDEERHVQLARDIVSWATETTATD